MQPYPPLGTLYAVSVLREAGVNVSFYDTMFSLDGSCIEALLIEERPSVFIIYDDCFNYLNKMCLSKMRDEAHKMIRLAKVYGCKVIVYSSDATDHAQAYIQQGADFVLSGEGEITLKELTQALFNKQNDDYSSINGLTYIQHNTIVSTDKRTVIHELDSLPLPAWDVVDINAYKSRWLKKHGYFSLNMVTTRGCPYKCNWCAKPIYGNRYNSHSPERIIQELVLLKQAFNPDHIWFCDDIFGLKPNWIHTFSALIQEKKIVISFKIQSRADLLIQDETVQYLGEAGCKEVWIGAESGSQNILDAMDKGITIEQIHTSSKLLKKHNIKPCFFLQFGYPGETMENIESTIRMIHELLPEDIGISVSYPLPGTVFYNRVKDELTSKSNWVDSDDLDLMFKNTYSPGFYKQLHRYVHKTYREHQAKYYLKQLFQTNHTNKKVPYKRMAALPYYYVMAKLEKYRLTKYRTLSK